MAVVEQPLSPGQPAAAAGHLALEEQPEGQPERAPCGSRYVAQAQVLVIRARPEVSAIIVPADQVRGHGKAVEVLRFKRRVAVRDQTSPVR